MRCRWCKVIVLTIVLVLSLTLMGCERPFPTNDTSDTPVEETTPDPNMGGGVPGDVTETPMLTPEPITAEETPEASVEEETPTEEATAVPTPVKEATPEPTADTDSESGGAAPAEEPDTAEPEESATAVAEEAEEPVEEPTTEVEPTESAPTNEPIAHVVEAGENLFRIGLQYNQSWLVIAEYNDIANPTGLTAGQTILIPPVEPAPDTSTPEDPGPTPSPLTETIHIVQPGENLFRIGLSYGMSWTQVAEANGIVNPNQIYVGQELKIPVNTPGPTPEFTHVVQQGETLFMISVRYGVPWTAVAEANNIQSPYVIYEGQTLFIPGE